MSNRARIAKDKKERFRIAGETMTETEIERMSSRNERRNIRVLEEKDRRHSKCKGMRNGVVKQTENQR